MKFTPVNRHILINPIELEKEESQVLLPEDYKLLEEQFKLCKVLEIASDCTKEIKPSTLKGCFVVVNAGMIEEIKIEDEKKRPKL